MTTKMNFGAALAAMRSGLRCRRSGWNGKGMWLAVLEQPDIRWTGTLRDYMEANANAVVILPTVVMRTADGALLLGWLASQTDMLAHDWEIVA